MNTETESGNALVIDTIQPCGACGGTFFLAEGILTIAQGHIEFVCLPCKRGE